MIPLSSAGPAIPLQCIKEHMKTNTHTYSLSLSRQTEQTQPSLCTVFSVTLRSCMCALGAARQTVNKQYCLMSVFDSVCLFFVGLFEFVCVHLCFSMRERELERDGDKASISLLPWSLARSQMKGFGYDGAAHSSPPQSQSNQNWLYTSYRVGKT